MLRCAPFGTLPAPAVGAILLAEGYASLATEILALQRMVLWAGSTVSVTEVLLAVYLATLAGGYRRARRLVGQGDPRPRLAARLSVATGLVVRQTQRNSVARREVVDEGWETNVRKEDRHEWKSRRIRQCGPEAPSPVSREPHEVKECETLSKSSTHSN